MNDQKEQIAFDVETSRILQILSSEIYDSPNAFLRENVQNAYDAILMRCTAQKLALSERSITITVEPRRLIVQDDGIGMNDDVLKNNFWKAGSSGKRSELAQRSGVIGTFGIGAMANFGVCTALRVETRHIDSEVTLVSSAIRDNLRIAQNCIDLERVADARGPGTIITAELDPSFSVDEASVCDYLRQYVRFLPVPLLVNSKRISGENFQDALASSTSDFVQHGSRPISRADFAGTLHTFLNAQGRALARFTDISLNSNPLSGEVLFIEQGGQTLGYRNLFGLAPVPISSTYGFGGYVNLNILHPTAGREALSRESIQHVANIVELLEAEVSKDIAQTSAADQNQYFQNYILSRGLTESAGNVKITVQVGSVESELPDIIQSTGEVAPHSAFEPAPPILRPELSSPMKVLTVSTEYAKLNNFKMFLALSDRLLRIEGEFLRWPHTTKLMWGMHRVIYIFTDATGGLSLYYDIELKEPLDTAATGGAMLPTTTIMTKNRVYVPMPAVLEPAFQITAGAKEFFVRFDTIP
jgi:molecular chaperone HtpG